MKHSILFSFGITLILSIIMIPSARGQSDIFLGKFSSETEAVDKISGFVTRYWGLSIVYRKEIGAISEERFNEYVDELNDFIKICMEIRNNTLSEKEDMDKYMDLIRKFYEKFEALESMTRKAEYNQDVKVFFDRSFFEKIIAKKDDYKSGKLKLDKRVIFGCGNANDWRNVKILNLNNPH